MERAAMEAMEATAWADWRAPAAASWQEEAMERAEVVGEASWQEAMVPAAWAARAAAAWAEWRAPAVASWRQPAEAR
jgi:hypothetical protein